MKNIKAIFKGLFVAFDSLEFIVVAMFGTALFFAIPFYIVRNLFNNGYVILAVFLSFVVIVSFGICIRDFKKKKWSGLSILIVVLWIICFVISGWMLMS